MKSGLFVSALLAAAIGLSSSTASADPFCRPCPYNCGTLGLGGKQCSDLPSSGGICCVDLNKKGKEIAEARERAGGTQAAAAAQDKCPPGFQPSEQKCTPQERRRGCKDIRLPSGLGCVKR